MPRTFAVAVRRVARATAGPADGQQERQRSRVVAWERTLRTWPTTHPSASRGRTPAPCAAGVAHGRSSTSGITRNSPVRAANSTSAIAMLAASDSAAFCSSAGVRGRYRNSKPSSGCRSISCSGNVTRGRVPRRLGRLDPRRQLGEAGRQIAGLHALVRQLGPTPHDGPLRAVEADAAVLIDTHHEDHRRPVDVRQQAGRALRQRRRVQRRPPIGQVHGHAPIPRLGVERVARLHEPADVGDRVAQHDVAAVRLDRERLVEIGRSRPGRSSRTRSRCGRRAQRRSARPTARCAASSTSGGKPSGISNSDRIRSRPAAIAAAACSSSRISEWRGAPP